ncbi:ABC transporter permease [Caenimonas sedimenti]|uniref:ABC transporter permease n=2 Tax=Caenimonas sedimenti TaxID=2596921 RepID=A0A562ZT70_9BURK|nr:ABC transporter permease [Caenimonas sedimenti]
MAAFDAAAWRALLAEPQLPRALLYSLATGLIATVLSVVATAWILSHSFGTPGWGLVTRMLAPMLAMPHAAFAIGLAFLLSPSGWILRALSPWATGFTQPPDWPTSHDPWGVGLVLALVGKEIPFLLWTAASQLQRADTGAHWARELDLARTMGYARRTAWWRVVWPQLWPRLAAPVLAVGAYSMTVVDVALVIGPASPPTAAVLAWQWLLDADPAVNAQGAAGAWLLALMAAVAAGAAWASRNWPRRRSTWTDGRRGAPDGRLAIALLPVAALVLAYALSMAVLTVGSVAGVWPFPRLWPQLLSLEGWRSVFASTSTLTTTLGLAAASSLAAMAWGVAWLETAPPAWDARLRRIAYLPLLLPSVLWVVGMHRLALAWHIDGRWLGLWLAHTLAALPYVLIALSPSYLGFDVRYAQLAATFGRGRFAFLLRVKWPLLRAGLASALAVAFAVSVAQYLPTSFIGAGRYATVTTEAVTLSSGGQRSLVAAYAWLQWLLPALMFAGAAWLGRPRRFRERT